MTRHIIVQPDLSITVELQASGVCIEVPEALAFPVLIEDAQRSAELSKILASSLPKIDKTLLAEMVARSDGRPVVVNTVFPPDPWLLAVAYVMWEGMSRGLTWDTVKVLIENAIKKMQSLGVAPKQPGERQTATGFHFSWSGQLKFANLVELNSKLEAEYSRMTEEKRKAIPRASKKEK